MLRQINLDLIYLVSGCNSKPKLKALCNQWFPQNANSELCGWGCCYFRDWRWTIRRSLFCSSLHYSWSGIRQITAGSCKPLSHSKAEKRLERKRKKDTRILTYILIAFSVVHFWSLKESPTEGLLLQTKLGIKLFEMCVSCCSRDRGRFVWSGHSFSTVVNIDSFYTRSDSNPNLTLLYTKSGYPIP